MTRTEDLSRTSEEIRQALLGNGVDALGRLLTEDYCGVDPTGGRHDRATMLHVYRPGGVQLHKYDVRDVATRIIGDVGLVMGVGSLNGRYGDHAFRHTLRFLDVYVHRDSGWLLFVSQVTEVASEAVPAEAG